MTESNSPKPESAPAIQPDQARQPDSGVLPSSEAGYRLTGEWINIGFAAIAAILALGGFFLQKFGYPSLGWISWISTPIELTGGVVYHASLTADSRYNHRLRRVWITQLAAVFFLGVALTSEATWAAGGVATQTLSAVWWLILTAVFFVGLYLHKWIDGSSLRRLAQD